MHNATTNDHQNFAGPGQVVGIEEFLYMDPDTGIIVCMIADGDGFRPATAIQEFNSLPEHWLYSNTQQPFEYEREGTHGIERAVVEDAPLDEFVKNFEHAYLAPTPG